MYKKFFKRFLDITLSIIALIIFWWFFALIALLVRINMGSPILYKSERMGKDEKPIQLYKFRSMTNETDENGVLLPGPQRLTKFGKLLRSTSMDELPSLINIIKGDLSIIGPRPLLMKYQPYYFDHERARHSIRPGLTGWAQINGRNNASWDKKFELDVEYVENLSFWFDIKVFFLSIYKVLKRSDIVQDNQQTDSLYIVRAYMVPKDAQPQNSNDTKKEIIQQ